MGDLFFHLYRRADGFGNSSSGMADHSTKKFINELILENSVQSRTATILLASFNVAAAITMMLSIFYDAWRSSRTRILLTVNPRRRLDFLRKIHPAEIVPLALSIGIIVQGVTFIGVQGTGLTAVFTGDCGCMTQLIWPAVWIVGYVLLVFSLEVALRGLQRNRFGPRGRWNTFICWVVIALMVLVTWIPSHLRPTRMRHCEANLVWWAAPWSDFGIGIASGLIGLYIATAMVITRQLFQTAKMNREERISASRTVYYLVVGIVMMALILPFYIFTFKRHDSIIPAKIAGIVLNLFGLVMCFLHLLLRSNTDASAIRPLSTSWARRSRWRIFGTSDLDVGVQMQIPVALERSMSQRQFMRRQSEKERGLLSPESPHITYDIRSPHTTNSIPPSPMPIPPPRVAGPWSGLSRKKSQTYSCFPNEDPLARKLSTKTAASVDSDVVLLPPQPLFVRRHQRDSSNVSSATVQIGLRLSHGILPPTREISMSSTHLPIQSPDSVGSSILRLSPSPSAMEAHRQSSAKSMDLPIQLGMPTPTPESPPPSSPEYLEQIVLSPAEPSASLWPKRTASLKNRRNGAQIVVVRKPSTRDPRNKRLPPTPDRPVSETLSTSDRGGQPLNVPRRSISDVAHRRMRRPTQTDKSP